MSTEKRNIISHGFARIKNASFLNKILNFKHRKRFSTYLVTTFVVLATLSVFVILVALYGYFGKQVEAEFRKKILAEKGQVEIILNNRISSISDMLKDLGSDNIIRVTVMLDGKSQLKDRVSEFYPSREGVYFFVKKQSEESVIPETYPNLSQKLIDFAQKTYPYGEVIDDGNTHLVWWFSAPIMMHQTQLMGTAYALYDMTQDDKLMSIVSQTVGGDVSVVNSDRLYSLISKKAVSLSEEMRNNIAMRLELLMLSNKLILSKIDGFDNLYFQSSLEALISAKRKVSLWIGFLSIVILTLSILMSIYLGKKMVEPLRQMTKKAIQISEGEKDLLFENNSSNYWEFNQLSQAFNYMLANLKNAEEQSRYKELLENVDDAVYILDREGNVLEANEAAYAQLGYSPEQFFELNLTNLIPADDAGLIIDQLGKDIEHQAPQKITVETSHAKIDGDPIPVEIHSRAISYRGRNVILNVARDITARRKAENEKKHLESQLIHSQKMEAVGTLAGGIAHDFNNLLMGIQGYVSLMRLQTDPEDPNDEYIQGIETAVTNAANLTNQLLGFARKGKYSLIPTSLNSIVENSSKMFTRTRKEIPTHKKLQANLWSVKVDPGQIEQVLINLYLNAWHAMPDGGDIYIQTENVCLSEEYCKPFEVPQGNYVKVSVTDTGMGIEPDIIERIFEPFFTTKEVGKGTGLGLASAYGIIKNHNGIIRVYSEKNHGTTFNLYLPASNLEEVDDIKISTEMVKGNEAILLVDDEKNTIQVEELMLRKLGYQVTPALGGKEAVKLYKEKMVDFDLVALDMIMPEMNGKDTYDALKKINPAVKVLLVSGYSQNKQIDELMDQGCHGFIQKPFDIVQLSQKLREVLEERPLKIS
ncbi:MAG: PAS domain S-box protein [Deltaproteobacteria bacterium]|nr:PAS domain S-box protein [Deltaproteobacteria bacterium]